jgi:hypothetical protein
MLNPGATMSQTLNEISRMCQNRPAMPASTSISDRGREWASDVTSNLTNEYRWVNHSAYQAACDTAYAELEKISGSATFTPEFPTIVCVLRNEEYRLPAFLKHYRSLGVRSVHLIDNGSSDRTRDIALADPAVTLWSTSTSYSAAAFGQLWVGGLVRRHGLGKWILNVDADEFLVYTGMEKKDLGALVQWLLRRHQTRLFAPMIDMYARGGFAGLSGELWARLLRREPWIFSKSPYFDGRGEKTQYAYQFRDTPFAIFASGGPRWRMMDDIQSPLEIELSKVPLAFWDEETAYACVHFPYPFAENPRVAYAAMLHFKFLRDFSNKVETAIAENQHWSDSYEYRQYRKWLNYSRRKTPFSDKYSTRYRSPDSLVAARLVEAVEWN